MSDRDLRRETFEEIRQLLRSVQTPRGTIVVPQEVAEWLAQPMPAAAVAAEAPAREAGMAPPQHAPRPVAAPAPLAPVAPATPATAPGTREAALAELAAAVSVCTQCGLSATRTQTVFGVGNPYAEVVFVGEAPGADEDRTGVPFVGKAGRLLTDIIEKGMQIPRDSVYICNVLKCRPPGNRDPNAEEVFFCEPFLKQQLAIIQPKVIVALGRHAAHTLLKTDLSTTRLRGIWHRYEGIPLRVTYHPSYLLRQPEEKRKTWEDIQEVMRLMNTGTARP